MSSIPPRGSTCNPTSLMPPNSLSKTGPEMVGTLQLPQQQQHTPNCPQNNINKLNQEEKSRTMYSLYRAKINCCIIAYLESKTKKKKELYSLAELLLDVKDVIKQEKMCDLRNPQIIICSPELEQALDTRAFHVTQIRDLVLKQLEPVVEQSAPAHGEPTFPEMTAEKVEQLRLHRALLEQRQRAAGMNAVTSVSAPRTMSLGALSQRIMAKRTQLTQSAPPQLALSQSAPSQIKLFLSPLPQSLPSQNSSSQQTQNSAPLRTFPLCCPSSRLSQDRPTSMDCTDGGVAAVKTTCSSQIIAVPPATNSQPITLTATSTLHEYFQSRQNSSVFADHSSRFMLKDKLREVLSTLPMFDHNRSLFYLQEVNLMLSKYLLSKQKTMFDTRNVSVAIIKGDPLADALGVDAFHRIQVNALLRNQLIFVDKLEPTPPESSTTSDCPVPGFPTIVRAASMPTSVLSTSTTELSTPTTELLNQATARKRNPSETLLEEARKKCKSNVGMVSESDTDTESELEAATEDVDANGTDSEQETYGVEYEIDSGDEETRPALAGGGSGSSTEDSDIEAVEITPQEEKPEDCENWADSETEVEDRQDLKDTRPNMDTAACFGCGEPRYQSLKYCRDCWSHRRSWTADRPKNKKSKRERNQNRSGAGRSEDETDGGSRTEKNDSGVSSQESDLVSQEKLEEVASGSTEDLSETVSGENLSNQEQSISVGSVIKNENSREPKGEEFERIRAILLATKMRLSSVPVSNLCVFCYKRQKNASIIHGRLGHQVCCYPCAKKLWAKQSRCPVCRRKIEKIVKIIVA